VGFISILSDLFIRTNLFRGRRGRDNEAGNIFMLIGIVTAILAPIAGVLMQLAISRKREFLADASGALLTRYPDALASALEKISSDPTPMARANNTTAHLWLNNPFKDKEGGQSFLSKLFMTHPPIEDRIKALRGMKI
jgi:heat shock protein HtpX